MRCLCLFLLMLPALLVMPLSSALADYTIQQYSPGDYYASICLTDMNGDGTPEVLAANSSTYCVEIWSYSTALDTLIMTDFITGFPADIHDIAAADLDHDEDIDIVVTLRFYGLYACLQEGGGWNIIHLDGTYGAQVMIVDFDGDGNLDIFDGVDWGYMKIFYGDGMGGFTLGPTPECPHTYGAACGFNAIDLNHDSRPDLIGGSSEWDQPGANVRYMRAYVNIDTTGTIEWSESIGPDEEHPDGVNSSDNSAADLDGNGYIDQVFCTNTERVCIYWGHAMRDSLFWTLDTLDTYAEDIHAVHLFDLNDDGNLDLVVIGCPYFNGLRIYYGDGSGNFTYAEVMLDHGIGARHGVKAADINADGWMDIVAARWSGAFDGFEVLFKIPEFADAPRITSIEDVGNDQGRQVRIEWMRSKHDAPSDTTITGYGIYRRQDQYLQGAAEESGKQAASILLMRGLRLDGWDYIATVPARGDSIYQFVAPTLCDSTAGSGICWSVFFVSAMTPDPLVYFDSWPDSGYSVDNLAPGPPENLEFEPPMLTWDEAEEEDFDYFSVYGSTSPQFDETAELIGYTCGTNMDIWHTGYPFYHVTATDFGGNEGEAASIAIDWSAAPDDAISGEGLYTFALGKSMPNPASRVTEIHFSLPKETHVALKILDLTGRTVITLVDEHLGRGSYAAAWEGKDQSGRDVLSGVYFYRLEAGSYIQTRRVALLR